ncbi:MAG: PadR family transcriptional regulator [Oscillospiraceae bacterium]|nr:PadR family transcriptional regulator [Oscillospiraceae bacterium]
MYPILYRLIDKGYIADEQVLVGRRRTRVYYHLTDSGKDYLEHIEAEYFSVTDGINSIFSSLVDSPSEQSDQPDEAVIGSNE